MQVIREEGQRVPIKAWVGRRPFDTMEYGFDNSLGQVDKEGTIIDIEDQALTQLKNLARLPFIAGNGVAVMPDVHAGKGSTVGTVIATEKAVIPAAVGVDIGCGMNAVRLSLKASDLPDSLVAIRHQIERDIPMGAGGQHDPKSRYVPVGHDDPQPDWNRSMHPLWDAFHKSGIKEVLGEKVFDKAWHQLGSLGSGNHFIELCTDESQDVWVMLHSGSRGIGNMVGTAFIEIAKKKMEGYFITLPDSDLAYIPESDDDFDAYVKAVGWCQNYALENRRQMMLHVIAALRRHIPVDFTITQEAINCHHNYIEKESHFGKNMWVTRKGAIRARVGDLGIIPGSMGQQSYIVKGKGNTESYCSCSHGAGRAMSRAAAKKRFTLADLEAQTAGVECRKDEGVLDEIPSSYKRLDVVMENQKDLVEIVHTLKAVMCVKGN